jgi:hypothetical protein
MDFPEIMTSRTASIPIDAVRGSQIVPESPTARNYHLRTTAEEERPRVCLCIFTTPFAEVKMVSLSGHKKTITIGDAVG